MHREQKPDTKNGAQNQKEKDMEFDMYLTASMAPPMMLANTQNSEPIDFD